MNRIRGVKFTPCPRMDPCGFLMDQHRVDTTAAVGTEEQAGAAVAVVEPPVGPEGPEVAVNVVAAVVMPAAEGCVGLSQYLLALMSLMTILTGIQGPWILQQGFPPPIHALNFW